jgi:hypothetical protein
MSDLSAEIVSQKAKGRSRMTNGTILPYIDGRSTWARRLRDLISLHVGDLGGPESTSEGERAIIRRASVLIVELERMELVFAENDGAPDIVMLDAYQRASNSMRRLLQAVGLERRQKDVTPLLSELMEAAEAEEANHGQ